MGVRTPKWWVFPTYVGMNRGVIPLSTGAGRVPHIRGDEPIVSHYTTTSPRVPHIRGDEPS